MPLLATWVSKHLLARDHSEDVTRKSLCDSDAHQPVVDDRRHQRSGKPRKYTLQVIKLSAIKSSTYCNELLAQPTESPSERSILSL
jgi:hypothetical protein